MLYARRMNFRNCGRFSVIASDFGSDYRTHIHVTGEALHASFTRGATWKPRVVNLKDDSYEFTRDYNVAIMPVWFTPAVPVIDKAEPHGPVYTLGSNYFNVVAEFYPSTNKAYTFDKRGMLKTGDRPYYVPAYGMWQTILPDHHMATYAFSPRKQLLERYEPGQTFLLGKKRTMIQIMVLSKIVEGKQVAGACETPYLQVLSDLTVHFARFEVMAATMRYIILRGETRPEGHHIRFNFQDSNSVCLPDFYLDALPEPVRD